jgi:hypothetical protein
MDALWGRVAHLDQRAMTQRAAALLIDTNDNDLQ